MTEGNEQSRDAGKTEAITDAPVEALKPDAPSPADTAESQSYYWTPEWQAKEARADADARLGRSHRYNSAEEAIAALNR